jgi:hypothetical protein
MGAGTQHFFGGGGQTDVSILSLALVIACCVLLLCLPRRFVLVPMLVGSILIPLDQQVVLGGIHLTMSRLLILTGWVRLGQCRMQSASASSSRWTAIDTVFLLYGLSNAVMYVLLWGGDTGAIINRAGFLFNAFGTYFFMRYFLTAEKDLELTSKTLVLVMALIAVGMVAEQATGRNLLAVIGGLPAKSVLRDGAIRAQGTFVHPLTAGAAGATLLPLAIGLWWVTGRNRLYAIIGALASIAAGLASRSSTAVLVLTAGVGGLALWRYRRHLRFLRWTMVLILIVLHLVMKAPVWALMARIDLTGSSSGYHRYILVDRFIDRFSEWWLVGTRGTSSWGWDMWDTINSYVAAGTEGGLLNFVLFIALFVVAFSQLGRARERAVDDPALQRLTWVLGTLLCAHAVAFFGIAYFDQSQFIWYTELAMIGAAVALTPQRLTVETSDAKIEAMAWSLSQNGPREDSLWPAHDHRYRVDANESY